MDVTVLEQDLTDVFQGAVKQAASQNEPLSIQGNQTKAFYGRATLGEPLDVSGHRGIVHYAPTELVITARGGTPLREIEAVLDEQGQQLGFEPPHFGGDGSLGATLAGTVACGFSGPRRPYAGAVRDFILGVRCLSGKAEVLSFGGEVMKNVAGFDASRLMAGSMGTLAIMLDISIKVIPKPASEKTQVFECTQQQAFTMINKGYRSGWPLSATAFDGGQLYLRFSGSEAAVVQVVKGLGGEALPDASTFWQTVRDHQHPFFDGDAPLWRLSVPPAAKMPELGTSTFIEWGGALRWCHADKSMSLLREQALAVGGQLTLFKGGDRECEVFQTLDAPMLAVQQRLKAAFDPHSILNSGRLYTGI